MSAEYVRRSYSLKDKRGHRIRYRGRLGRITSFPGAYIRVALDGEKGTYIFHPNDPELERVEKSRPDRAGNGGTDAN